MLISSAGHPVLLGGVYDLTQAPQGKSGSASSLMNPTKQSLSLADLVTSFQRRGFRVPIPPFPAGHPMRSVDALRMLHAISSQPLRARVSHALFEAYWVRHEDISDRAVLSRILGRCTVRFPLACPSTKQMYRAERRRPSTLTGKRTRCGRPRSALWSLARLACRPWPLVGAYFGAAIASTLWTARSGTLPLPSSAPSRVVQRKRQSCHFFSILAVLGGTVI